MHCDSNQEILYDNEQKLTVAEKEKETFSIPKYIKKNKHKKNTTELKKRRKKYKHNLSNILFACFERKHYIYVWLSGC